MVMPPPDPEIAAITVTTLFVLAAIKRLPKGTIHIVIRFLVKRTGENDP